MITEQINADLIAAMKDREPARKEENQFRITTLRTLMAEVKNIQVNQKKTPDDTDLAAILQKGIKQFQETLAQAGDSRPDIVERERAKIAIYEKYLPPQMSREEIERVVDAAVASTGAKSPKDMGAVMAAVRPQTQGKADGRLVSEIVKAKLSQ